MIDLSSMEARVRETLADLGRYGFVGMPAQQQKSELLGEFLTVPFVATTRDRALEVHFSTGQGRRGPAIAAVILASDGRRIALHDWLLAHPEVPPLPALAANADGADVDRAVDAYCGQLKVLLEGPLMEILLGMRWESVPVDWQGLR